MRVKTRYELPWLYYPESDRVIINSHNFTTPWTPAVNGKMPIAAWVPSRDTAGNGTTTLTDLVGSNNGTLTNFAMSGSSSNWVADTDAGGVRAIATDGSNDYVAASSTPFVGMTNCSMFGWFKISSLYGMALRCNGITGCTWYVGVSGAVVESQRLYIGGTPYPGLSPSGSNTAGVWTHIGWTHNAGTVKFYRNGVLQTTVTATINPVFSGAFNIGGYGWAESLNGRSDDIRVFDQVLDLEDAEDLYASGSGRGVQA